MLDFIQRMKESNIALKVHNPGIRKICSFLSLKPQDLYRTLLRTGDLTAQRLWNVGMLTLTPSLRVNLTLSIIGSTSVMVGGSWKRSGCKYAHPTYQTLSISMGSSRVLDLMLEAYPPSGLVLSYGLVTAIFYLRSLVHIE